MRILTKDSINHIGQKIIVAGWVNIRRDHGGIVFLDLRDRSGILQAVSTPELLKDIGEEFVVEAEGIVQERPLKMVNPKIETGKVELKIENIKVLSKSEPLPFDIKGENLDLGLPTLLDYRPLTFKHPKIRAVFKIEEEIASSFRNTLRKLGFTEFQAPSIVPLATEGGSEVFHIDYYDYDAYLAQSPQLYKQIMVGAFERVFTICHAYRAEPSVTTRHISEYTSLDAEMGFIESWENLMDVCEIVMKDIFSNLKISCQKELEILDATIPQLDGKIPRLKMREIQKIILERTKKDKTNEPDLDPEDEKEICNWAKTEHGSELIFVTHYPTKKRPFYTYPDPADPDYTLSFDLLCRGLEITTGGQRINDYKQLVENIKKWGNDPKDFSFYLQAFKYGLPPEGGFAFGLERIAKQILSLENIREANPFPRDMERIDSKLSLLQQRKNTKKNPKKVHNKTKK